MTRKLESAIYDSPVSRQSPPYFEVRSKGTTIEYTDRFADAYDAYKNAPLPRDIVKIAVVAGRGFRSVIEKMGEIRHNPKAA